MAAFFCSPQPRPNRLTAFLCPFHFSSLFLYPPSALFILTIIFIFALPAPACPARSLPHFTYTGFLLSPLRLHQPPKRFQTNIPPSTACLCLPPPAGLHISAAPLFHILFFFLCIVINCVLNHFAIKCDLFALALPAPACPARSLPHFTYTGFLLSPLRLHQPPKRFQTNMPPNAAHCLWRGHRQTSAIFSRTKNSR